MSDLYTGAMGMITNENKLNVIGNNIANVKTYGHKKDIDTAKVFEESFMRILSNEEDRRIGSYQNQVHTDEVYTIFTQGMVEVTNRVLDVSIMDDVNTINGNSSYNFFEVEQDGQTYLTRDGHFQLDVEGNLNTTSGAYVLDVNGNRINLANNSAVSITENGEIRTPDGTLLHQLQVRSISESNVPFLEKHGENAYRVMTLAELENAFGPIGAIIEQMQNGNLALDRTLINQETLLQAQQTGVLNIFEPGMSATLKQGMLEQSNVELSEEMTKLMVAQNGFTSSSKVLNVMDAIKEKESNQLGL